MKQPEFHQFPAMFDQLPEGPKPDIADFYANVLTQVSLIANDNALRISHNQVLSERFWIKHGRPFYRMWPGIIDYLAKLDLNNIPSTEISLPRHRELCIRFPKNHPSLSFEIKGETKYARSVLMGEYFDHDVDFYDLHKIERPEDGSPTMVLWIDVGEYSPGSVVPALTFRRWFKQEGKSVQEVMNELPPDPDGMFGWQIPTEFVNTVVKVCLSALLLSENRDEQVIVPEVLQEAQYFLRRGKKLLKRPEKLSETQFDVGEEMSVNPHYRKGHPVWLKAGVAGREKGRLVFRKGHVVKREQARTLPEKSNAKES